MTLFATYKQPVSVLVLIHDQCGRILLLERADRPGFWQSVTGSREGNEDLLYTAQREVQEETGIAAAPADFRDWHESSVYEIYPHWRHRYAPGVTRNTEHVFSLCVPCDTPVCLSPREHLQFGWYDVNEAARKVFSPSNRDALRHLFAHGQHIPRGQSQA